MVIVDIFVGKELFTRIRNEIREERGKKQEAWEAPLVAYTIAALSETFGPLKEVIRELFQMEDAISSVVVGKIRTAFKRTLPQYKLKESLENLAEVLRSQENYEYIKTAIMHPFALLKRKEAIINDFNQLTSERESNVGTYSEIISLNLFFVYFLPFVSMYALLLLGHLEVLPVLTLVQLVICYLARKKLFYELT